jgi:hypothetical protein
MPVFWSLTPEVGFFDKIEALVLQDFGEWARKKELTKWDACAIIEKNDDEDGRDAHVCRESVAGENRWQASQDPSLPSWRSEREC